MKNIKKFTNNKDNQYMSIKIDRLNILIDKELKKKVRTILIQKEKTITDFVIEKMKELVKENDKKS